MSLVETMTEHGTTCGWKTEYQELRRYNRRVEEYRLAAVAAAQDYADRLLAIEDAARRAVKLRGSEFYADYADAVIDLAAQDTFGQIERDQRIPETVQ